MKLNYYLRGLGTGILVATLVFAGAGFGKAQGAAGAGIQPLQETAAETEQGGETETGARERLADRESLSTEESTAAGEGSETEESTAADEGSETEAGTEAGGAPGTGSAETGEDTESGDGAEIGADSASKGAGTEKSFMIAIHSGDSSETVSRRVAEAGLVASAQEYNRFLCSNGYDKKLIVGNHEIPAGATETEIAELLTGK